MAAARLAARAGARFGVDAVTPPAKVASAFSAGAMYGVWNAPATWRAITRVFAGGSAASLARPSVEPAATIGLCGADLYLGFDMLA